MVSAFPAEAYAQRARNAIWSKEPWDEPHSLRVERKQACIVRVGPCALVAELMAYPFSAPSLLPSRLPFSKSLPTLE